MLQQFIKERPISPKRYFQAWQYTSNVKMSFALSLFEDKENTFQHAL